MKKRITLGLSGNGMAERLARYLTECFGSNDMKHIASLIAAACKDGNILYAEADDGTVTFTGSDNMVSLENDVLVIGATNVAVENDELVLDYK